MHEQSSTPGAFNVAHDIHLEGPVRLDELKRAIIQMMYENKISGTCYACVGGQFRRTKCGGTFKILETSGIDSENMINACINMSFDLARDRLARVALGQENEGKLRLVVVQHHIIPTRSLFGYSFKWSARPISAASKVRLRRMEPRPRQPMSP